MTRVNKSIIVGRFVFLALMVMQCFFLASYPAYYEDEDAWYAVSLLFFPAVLMWWCLISTDETSLCQVYVFWMLYIWLGIVPMIGIVFGKTGDKVDIHGFWNANTLKMTLCITPFLHFLIPHTRIVASDRDVHVTQFNEWSAKAMMNLFDGIELIAVILDENECSHGISRHFVNTLIAFTCISFLWWPFDMLIYQPSDDSMENVVLDLVQVFFDTIFLCLRLGLSLGYGTNTSIFINKNIIIIIVYSRRIFNFFFKSQDANNGSTANQQGESRSSSASSTAPVAPANTSRGGHARGSRSSIAPLPTTSAWPPTYEDTPLPSYDDGLPPLYTSAPPPPYSTAPLPTLNSEGMFDHISC